MEYKLVDYRWQHKDQPYNSISDTSGEYTRKLYDDEYCRNINEFEALVKQHIDEGWVPQGAPTILTNGSSIRTMIQCMTRIPMTTTRRSERLSNKK
jgi:hypothetical protein